MLDDPVARRRWLVGESGRSFAEVANPDYEPSPEDLKQLDNQLDWELALELTERARRRFSLEQEGAIVIGVDAIDELTAKVAKTWPSSPFDPTQLAAVIAAVADLLRYRRAVSNWLLKRSPRTLPRNHDIRVGDRAVTQTRGFGKKKYVSQKDGVDIRPWTTPSHATSMTELVGRVLGDRVPAVNEPVETLVERLSSVGLLTEGPINGKKRSMLDEARVLVSPRVEQPLWRCDRCGLVRGSVLRSNDGTALCTNWRCPGTPRPFEPAVARDFYRGQYFSEPRRLLVREHSGQIESEVRLALEARFNDRAHPLIDALACTPTLEVGVSLDDLHAVLLRNLPPAQPTTRSASVAPGAGARSPSPSPTRSWTARHILLRTTR